MNTTTRYKQYLYPFLEVTVWGAATILPGYLIHDAHDALGWFTSGEEPIFVDAALKRRIPRSELISRISDALIVLTVLAYAGSFSLALWFGGFLRSERPAQVRPPDAA